MQAPAIVVLTEAKAPEFMMQTLEPSATESSGEIPPEMAAEVPEPCPFRSRVTPFGMVSVSSSTAGSHSLTMSPLSAAASASSRLSYLVDEPPLISSKPVDTSESEAVWDSVG